MQLVVARRLVGGVFPVCKCAAGRCEGRPVCLARWPHDEVCESLHDVCVMLTDDSVCCSVVFVAGSTAFRFRGAVGIRDVWWCMYVCMCVLACVRSIGAACQVSPQTSIRNKAAMYTSEAG